MLILINSTCLAIIIAIMLYATYKIIKDKEIAFYSKIIVLSSIIGVIALISSIIK